MIQIKAEDGHVEVKTRTNAKSFLSESMLIIEGLVNVWQKVCKFDREEAGEMLMAAYEILKDDFQNNREIALDSECIDLIEKFRKDKKDE